MDRATITQEYFVLLVNGKGRMPILNGTEAKAGIAAAGVMDLLLAEVIQIEKKKAEVVEALPEELAFLNSLFGYLQGKGRSVTKIVEDFSMSLTDARLKQLTSDIEKSLMETGALREEKVGLLGNKTVFIPSEEWKEMLIDSLKTEVTRKEAFSLHDTVLVSLMKETKILKQYFSKYEADMIKAKLKVARENQDSRIVKEMIGYIDEVMAAMAAAVVAAVN